jgi:integrase
MDNQILATNEPQQIVEYSSDDSPLELRHFIPSDKHPAITYLKSLAPSSEYVLGRGLDKVAAMLTNGRCDHKTLDWTLIEFQHVAALKSRLSAQHDFQYVNTLLSAVRGVARTAWQLDLLGEKGERQLAMVKSVRNVKGTALLAGRSLALWEVAALGEACEDGSVLGIRDSAMIALLVGAGLRRSEVVNLDMDDYNPVDGSLTIRAGKGNKSGICYIADDNQQFVDRWLEHRPAVEGPLLLPMRKGGVIEMRRMTGEAVLKQLKSRAEKVGIECTVHDCRRTFISEALEQGASIVAVQHQVRHSSVSQTAKYDRGGLRAQKRMTSALRLSIGGNRD